MIAALTRWRYRRHARHVEDRTSGATIAWANTLRRWNAEAAS